MDETEIKVETTDKRKIRLVPDYAIIRASYDASKNRKTERVQLVKQINKSIDDYVHYEDDEVRIPQSNVCVIWDNLPHNKYLTQNIGYSHTYLLKTFCEQVAKNSPCRLYIESPYILTDPDSPSMNEILENILLIWNTSHIVPTFLTDNFLIKDINKQVRQNKEQEIIARTKEQMKQLYEDAENYKGSPLYAGIRAAAQKELKRNLNEEMAAFIADENRTYFIEFFRSISLLLSSMSKKVGPDESFDDFLTLYFDWQMHKIQTKTCTEQINTAFTKPTWYRLSEGLERSPVYEEFCHIYEDELIGTAKKGNVPDPFQLLPFYYNKQKSSGTGDALYEVYLQFDEINSVIDAQRSVLSCKHKIDVILHNGRSKLDAKLKEYNLTIDDVLAPDSDFDLLYTRNEQDFIYSENNPHGLHYY